MFTGRDFVLSDAPTPLAAREWCADARGTPILMLHGWLDNLASFTDLAPRLDGRRCVAIDLPGHGQSGHRGPEASYLVPEALWDIERAVAALGCDRVILVSHSLGAVISLMYAAAFPHRVAAVAAVEGVVPQTEPADGFVKRLQLHAAARAKPPKPLTLYPSIDAALAVRVAVAQHSSADTMRPIVERGLRKVPGGYVWTADSRLRQPSAWRLTPDQAVNIIASVQCPVMLFKATEGLPWDGESLIGAAVKGRQWPMTTIKGFHHLHLDAPVEVAGVINQFLKGV